MAETRGKRMKRKLSTNRPRPANPKGDSREMKVRITDRRKEADDICRSEKGKRGEKWVLDREFAEKKEGG